jgi:hypothetical protein
LQVAVVDTLLAAVAVAVAEVVVLEHLRELQAVVAQQNQLYL